MTQHLNVTLRYVVIPGVTNLPKDIQELTNLIHSLPRPVTVELLPYHTYGRQKWQALQMNYTLDHIPEATPSDVATVAECLVAQGIIVINR